MSNGFGDLGSTSHEDVFTSVDDKRQAHTYLFYWLCTLVLSPRTVKHIPWGMR